MVVPVPDAAADLLARSEGELVAATVASDPADAFVHAHLAAVRAGAALLAVRGRPGPRSGARTVWDMVLRVAPELAEYTAFFAANAATRQAVEARRASVSAERVTRVLAVAEQFGDAVRALLADDDAQGRLRLRAS